MSQTNQKGFTLVEIAIVLVIIGLLLGGVLKGQELIASAKVKATIAEIDSFATAFAAYQDKYRAIPGDDRNAQNNTNNQNVINGNGDGSIGYGETGNVFQHLVSAGLLKGESDGSEPGGYFRSSYGGLIRIDDNLAGLNGFVICYNNLQQDVAEEIDRKLDDGSGTTGSVRGAGNGFGPGNGPSAYSNPTWLCTEI